MAGTAAPRIVRGNVGRGTGTTEEIPGAAGTYVFPTRIPIKTGDLFGIDTSGNLYFSATPGTGDSFSVWNPPLSDGGSGTAPSTNGSSVARLQLNADVEPDADGDGYGDETQDLCPTDAMTQGACPDKLSPETTITAQPAVKTFARQAELDFTSSEMGSSYECSLDGAAFAGCVSPSIRPVGLGPHAFQVRAIDAAGNVDPSPAVARWEVVKKKKHKRHHKHHHHHGHGHGHG